MRGCEATRGGRVHGLGGSGRAAHVKSCTPSTAYMPISSASSDEMLTRAGAESTSVIIRSRSPLARLLLSSRSTRKMRSTRSTRSSIGGSGRYATSSSWPNWSISVVHTRKKSKRHQLSRK